MELTVCIIDDDITITEQISFYIKQWSEKKKCPVKTIIKNDLLEVVHDDLSTCDIFILDVVVGSSNGIEFAKKLRALGSNATIAFVSNYNEYAINGYSVHAISYILKPISEKQIYGLLDHAIFDYSNYSKKIIHISLNGKDRFFQNDSILYIEAFRHQTTFYLKSGQESYNYSINSLEKQLLNSSLVRCHRSFIVNLMYIREVKYNSIHLYNVSTSVPLGRSYIDNVKSRLLWERDI